MKSLKQTNKSCQLNSIEHVQNMIQKPNHDQTCVFFFFNQLYVSIRSKTSRLADASRGFGARQDEALALLLHVPQGLIFFFKLQGFCWEKTGQLL